MLFDNQRALWLWMFSAQAERTWADALRTAQTLAGAGVLLVKAMDGRRWMSDFDNAPAAIYGPKALRGLQQLGAAQGCSVVPWVVAHGRDDAPAHAALGQTLVVDLEPYPGFWTDATDGVPLYLAALRAGGVREIYVSVDPRPPALAALAVAGWAAQTTAILPQCYWTDFGLAAEICLGQIAACARLDVPVVPVLPGDGAAGYAGFWPAARALGCNGVCGWRLGSMDAAALSAFAALDVAPPPDPCAALRDQIAALTGERDQLAATLDRVRAALTPVPSPVIGRGELRSGGGRLKASPLAGWALWPHPQTPSPSRSRGARCQSHGEGEAAVPVLDWPSAP
ncbi:MAG TPA: hypothetical protein VFD32_07510 [Dehalococcoidia bacterium]|nr:hypothetical protein [Dehalococcoidia bacterium]